MNSGNIKPLLALCLLAMGFLSVVTPAHIAAKGPTMSHWFSCGNMMASGVLLAAGLVHMLADSAQVLNSNSAEFPWAEFWAGLTVITFMVLEELLHLIFMSSPHTTTTTITTAEESHHRTSYSIREEEQEIIQLGEVKPLLPKSNSAISHRDSTRSVSSGSCAITKQPSYINSSRLIILAENDKENHSISTSPHDHSHGHQHQHEHPHDHQHDHQHQHEHHHHNDHLELHLHGSAVATGVLMLALSIHSILAGVSIGIETKPQELTSTAIAILAHKSFEGFCLGSSMANTQISPTSSSPRSSKIYWVVTVVFACATPLGILVGQQVLRNEDYESRQQDTDDNRIVARVQAVVAGTFLYISIVEIAAKEFMACRHDDRQHGSRWQKVVDIGKLLCFVLGYLAMSTLALYT